MTKDRLIELIKNADNDKNLEWYDLYDLRYGKGCAEHFADYLLAHSVTVNEWISVEDRLPDDSATVNLYTRSKIVGTGFYDKYTKSWVQYYSGGAISIDVTHWQPLPQPPKEVE